MQIPQEHTRTTLPLFHFLVRIVLSAASENALYIPPESPLRCCGEPLLSTLAVSVLSLLAQDVGAEIGFA